MKNQGIGNRLQGIVNAMRSRFCYNPKPKTYNLRAQRGFTLLLAAIVSSIVLSIGAAIFSIALKQVTLASTGKNSQFAFYAADSGAECALYWDIRTAAFATSSSSIVPGSVRCGGPEPVTAHITSADNDAATTTLFYATNNYEDENGDEYAYCVGVTIAKSQSAATNGIVTTIHADGYSTRVSGTAVEKLQKCTPATGTGFEPGAVPDAVLSDRSALQRSVELHY